MRGKSKTWEIEEAIGWWAWALIVIAFCVASWLPGGVGALTIALIVARRRRRGE